MTDKIVLSPSYMNKFKCIGEKCSDSCCVGWNIEIDKKSYQNYRKCTNKSFRVNLDLKIKRNRKSNSDSNYAKIILNEDNGKCPFLNEENLCDIYINMGQQYMSTTCSAYPRSHNKVNNILEESLTLSCPEAAKLVLDNESIMTFEEIMYDNKKTIIKKKIDTHKKIPQNYLEKYFWDLRIAAIDIIQNRNYSIDERIIVLGLLCDEINKFINNGSEDSILNIINKHITRVSNKSYKEFINDIPININIKVSLIRKIEGIKLLRGVNEKLSNLLAKALFGIGCINGATNEDVFKKYLIAKDKYDNSVEKRYSYILENYLVNHIFKNTFPLTNRNNIFDEYILMCVYYSLIKFNLIGLSAERELDKEEIIDFIQKFSRGIEHDPNYIKTLYENFKESEIDNMAYMSILIKD